MISKEISDLQIEGWCRRRGMKICKNGIDNSCKCVWIEPVVVRREDGKTDIQCKKCTKRCLKCDNFRSADAHEGCYFCKREIYRERSRTIEIDTYKYEALCEEEDMYTEESNEDPLDALNLTGQKWVLDIDECELIDNENRK